MQLHKFWVSKQVINLEEQSLLTESVLKGKSTRRTLKNLLPFVAELCLTFHNLTLKWQDVLRCIIVLG